MAIPAAVPWHKIVELRPDLLSGELELAEFAADLQDVALDRGNLVYRDRERFFSLTYPTHALRDLVREVVLRLAGKSAKANQQINVTFGGGKTHALIALYHLANDPATLPDVVAVREFRGHSGIEFTPARIALLAFDKIDAEKGAETKAPNGKIATWREPWTILAYQLAGEDGVRSLQPDGSLTERPSSPAEPLLIPLLERAIHERGAALVLIDEPLIYARGRARTDPGYYKTLADFFQYLTQAVAKTNRCALVASLLASDQGDPQEDRMIALRFQQTFTREREAIVEPVGPDDVSEILRRRLFTADSLRDPQRFRAPVVSAVEAIKKLDEQANREGPDAERRFLASYPFHPDLVGVLYSKWTNLTGFQRTRGVLRTFALALRDAVHWDSAPLVGTGVFLAPPKTLELCRALSELAQIATADVIEGRQQQWAAILEGEFDKARAIQLENATLTGREIERAVVATFLHSQPVGNRALASDLLRLLGETSPDKIVLGKALREWVQRSWFLDENETRDLDGELPKAWRLGSRPNLQQMHDDAARRVADSAVEDRLASIVRSAKDLSNVASAPSVDVHLLPGAPRDIGDDQRFHYAVLGPAAASEAGRPSGDAARFIDETTGPDRPRKNRNAVVLAVPSRVGIAQARDAVRNLIGWEHVKRDVPPGEMDEQRRAVLDERTRTAESRARTAVRQAYDLAVAVSEQNKIVAYKLTPSPDPLFTTIKAAKNLRILDRVNPEALLPDGPYNLWREGETSRFLNQIVGAFCELPHLPKVLETETIRRAMLDGVRHGLLTMRLERPDHSVRTFWLEDVDPVAINESGLEVVLPKVAALASIPVSALKPGGLPELWGRGAVTVGDVVSFFKGERTATVGIGASSSTIPIPRAPREAVYEAVAAAVQLGLVWYRHGALSLLAEAPPPGTLVDEGTLAKPPDPVDPVALLPDSLSSAWHAGATTVSALRTALDERVGEALPWVTVSTAVDVAIAQGLLQLAADSAAWARDPVNASAVKLLAAGLKPPPLPGVLRATNQGLSLADLQTIADAVPALLESAATMGLSITADVTISVKRASPPISTEEIRTLNAVLKEAEARLNFEA